MSHGFDPNGFKYNWNGTYVGSILNEADTEEYYDRIQCYIDQYDQIPVVKESEYLDNGTRTQTENVADNVGLLASYMGWKAYRETVQEDTKLPGVDMNEEQMFFWSWAHVWCGVSRPAAFANYTGVHSPYYVRVIGSLQNSAPFQDAFGCDTDNYMSSEEKCELW